MITNDVSDYKNLLVRIVHIICNDPLVQWLLFLNEVVAYNGMNVYIL